MNNSAYVCFLMIEFPGSKINLGLNVIQKLENGYHSIESIFIPTSFSDILEIIPAEKESAFNYSGISIPGNEEDNLIYKAWKLLSKSYPLPSFIAYLHKVIPLGAGLGGGSADGSAMLKLLNHHFNLNIPSTELSAIAAKLGADCPFFIDRNTAYVEGIGELLTPISIDLSKLHLLIICPGIHINTGEAFRNISPKIREIKLTEIVANYPIEEWKNHIFNDFEEYAFKKHSELSKIKSALYDMGALYASMSGTGSAIYGFFKSEVELGENLNKYVSYWEKG